MIHLFAFVRGLREDLEPGLERHSFGTFDAIAGRGRPEPLEHGLVVERLPDSAESVLPVRFGEHFQDEAALWAAVVPRREALEQSLERVAGCVEVSLRIAGHGAPREAADGRSYLLERRREEHGIEALHGVLAKVARAAVLTSGEAQYLVPRDEIDSFASQVERLLEGQPDLDAVCTGPWAPYSFAEAT